MTAQEIIQTMLSGDAFSNGWNMQVEEVYEGYCKISMEVVSGMQNGFGIAHGGVAFSLADSAFAFAANAGGRKAKTIQVSCMFLDASVIGQKLTVEARVIKAGRSIGFLEAEVKAESQLVFSATCSVKFSGNWE